MFSYWSLILAEPVAAVILMIIIRETVARLSKEAANILYMVLSTLSCISMTWPAVDYLIASARPVVESTRVALPYIGPVSIWINPLSAMYLLATGIVATCVSVYSLPYMLHRLEELGLKDDLSTYYILYVLYILGLVGIAYFTNLIIMFVFLELSIVTSFLLILYYGYGDRHRVALLYFIWSQIGSLTLLCGLILILMAYGSVYVPAFHPATLPQLAMYLVLIGCLIKMGTFLVHFWLPWAHAEAPSPISAILSPVQIGIMSYVLIEILHTLYRTALQTIAMPLLVYGIITGIYGAVMALSEQDVKRFLAYSSIAHMGALVVCVAYPSTLGEVAAAIVFMAHAFAKALLFMCSGYIIYRTGLRSFSTLGGLYELMTSSSIMGIIGFISLSGVFNVGLLSKIYLTLILMTAASTLVHGAATLMMLILLYVVMLCLSVAYCFYAVKRMYFGRPREISVLPYTVYMMEVPMAILALCTILFLFPTVIMPMVHMVYKWNFLSL